MGWVTVSITHLTAVGLWLQRGPKCTLCKANMIPVWVETAGGSVCGSVTHRSPGCRALQLSPDACPQERPAPECRWDWNDSISREPAGFWKLMETINQVKSLRKSFGEKICRRRRNRLHLKKKKIGKIDWKGLGSQGDPWLSQNCSAELNLKRWYEPGSQMRTVLGDKFWSFLLLSSLIYSWIRRKAKLWAFSPGPKSSENMENSEKMENSTRKI